MKKLRLSRNDRIIAGICLCSSFFLLAVIFDLFPLGIPGQWVYPYNTKGIFSFFHLSCGCLIFATICCLIRYIRSTPETGRSEKIIVLLIAAAAGFFFDVQVLKSGRMGMGENLFAIYEPFATGYYQKALKIDSAGSFLAEFNKNQRYRGFINHSDVHPPGRTLLSYGIYTLVRNSPGLTSLLLKTMPCSMSDMFVQIQQENLLPQFKFTDAVKAAAVLHIYLFLLIILAGKLFFALIIWQTYGLDFSLETSVLYLFVPTIPLFLGHYDGLLGTVSAFIILYALWKPGGKYLPAANFILGICCSVFILQSMAVAVPCLWLVFFWLSRSYEKEKTSHLKFAVTRYFIPYGLGILAFIIFMYLVFDFILPGVLFACFRNNELFFQEQSTRSIIWKLLNPVEFLIGAGLSTFFLITVWAFDYFRAVKSGFLKKIPRLSDKQALEFASVLILAVLLITPTRAEVARQWSLAWPFVYILAAKAVKHYQFRFYQTAILGGILVIQIFIFRFFLQIVLMQP
ncbi:MAG: hypothetical protein PHV82_10680 [Victivallaceae bacterium]|nr:hypothetical protein [Victivallaceae bacterium]